MASYRKPKITWGSGFTGSIDIAYPLDNAVAYSKNREGSESIRTPSGVEDAWIVGIDYHLEGDIRWIPTTDTTSPVATGWDGAGKWQEFLEWARKKNEFRWYPDATLGTYHASYIVEPIDTPPTLEPDGTRTIKFEIRQASSSFLGY